MFSHFKIGQGRYALFSHFKTGSGRYVKSKVSFSCQKDCCVNSKVKNEKKDVQLRIWNQTPMQFVEDKTKIEELEQLITELQQLK
jgi:hypothetical protein